MKQWRFNVQGTTGQSVTCALGFSVCAETLPQALALAAVKAAKEVDPKLRVTGFELLWAEDLPHQKDPRNLRLADRP